MNVAGTFLIIVGATIVFFEISGGLPSVDDVGRGWAIVGIWIGTIAAFFGAVLLAIGAWRQRR